MEPPSHPGEHMRPGRQPGRQAVDGDLLQAIHHPADAPYVVYAVQAAVLMADILCTHLAIGPQAPEVPVGIIRGTQI